MASRWRRTTSPGGLAWGSRIGSGPRTSPISGPRKAGSTWRCLLDLASRRVVGWALAPRLDRHLVLTALERALARRAPAAGLLHHSDRGSPHASTDYQARLQAAGIIGSMSRRGDCWDNAVVESFFATLKRELVHRERWATRTEAHRAIADYLESWYNVHRRHSALGYLSPAASEARLTSAA